ncbi:hypothetical protein EYC80_003999 [Monilinia laxa]|uniref:Uncharacterized protein n=1 Tax=Monilinia laxa TaxID=61186 RepID=A0A5N6KLR6_MONLA|nr:hypothetical protein EYC80_003999 [Monilinia laxa]
MNKHPLLKGPLRPPRSNPSTLSYTEPLKSRNEVSINAKGVSIKVVEFDGSAIPQPYLDPSIMQKRARTEIGLKEDQEKIRQ